MKTAHSSIEKFWNSIEEAYRSPFPVCNVHSHSEPVATDTLYADTPAIVSSTTIAQVFVETDSLVCDVYALMTDTHFIAVMQNIIKYKGAMTKFINYHTHVEINKKVHNILCYYITGDWQSKPHYQHQNPVKGSVCWGTQLFT